MDSGAKQDIEKSSIYEQAGRLSEENTEESLEQAMFLYQSIRFPYMPLIPCRLPKQTSISIRTCNVSYLSVFLQIYCKCGINCFLLASLLK